MTIQQALANIKNAVYGKDVRSSIHDGIKICYDERLTGGLNTVSNLDDFNSGIALFTSRPTNAPFKSTFLLIAGGDRVRSFQIAYDANNTNPPYFRKKQNSTWGNWERL